MGKVTFDGKKDGKLYQLKATPLDVANSYTRILVWHNCLGHWPSRKLASRLSLYPKLNVNIRVNYFVPIVALEKVNAVCTNKLRVETGQNFILSQ
jgi:hypothetical protein